MSPTGARPIAFFSPNARKMKKSATVPITPMALPTRRTTVNAR
jgi:hypothetical protein